MSPETMAEQLEQIKRTGKKRRQQASAELLGLVGDAGAGRGG